jgi:hypothetical protein
MTIEHALKLVQAVEPRVHSVALYCSANGYAARAEIIEFARGRAWATDEHDTAEAALVELVRLVTLDVLG